MDYLGWELKRQRAALWALLGGGSEEKQFSEEGGAAWEEGGARGEKAAPGENTAREGGKTLPGGTRRSPAGSGAARRRAAGSAGRYAGGGGEAGEAREAGSGFPGAWETALEARETAGGLEAPADGGAAPPVPERRSGERGAASRRKLPKGARGPAREGTGPRTGPWGSFGGTEAGAREEAELQAETAAEAAMRKRAGERPAGERAAGGADSLPGEEPGGRKAGGYAFAAPRRVGMGTARSGEEDLGGAPGRGERLSRVPPWGGGWESPALRAEDGARALSRAVQRDARRYDGGFTIY
nr:hypothetical protein [uncultured Oscillibacter sp.]